jgi:flagellar motor switch protein FliN/FliY
MTGVRSSAKVSPDLAVSGQGEAPLAGQFGYDAAPGARVSVLVGESVWHGVGKSVLAAAGIDEANLEELEGTFLEVLQQSLSPLAQALGKMLGREVNAGQWQKSSSAEELSEWVGVVLELQGESIGELWISASTELLGTLSLEPVEEKEEPRQASPDTAIRQGVGRSSKTLDLLLEVELPVGVSFGRTQMRLKDAVKLSTGSIVELNRTITEPVEIIVNNCVIARGEVVVVEGNYGVRIKEIISREERLRTLF